jgi:hypothetical protein
MKTIILLSICCCLTFGKQLNAEEAVKEERFVIIYHQASGLNDIQILLDKETGVKYMMWKYGFGAAIIKLQEEPNLGQMNALKPNDNMGENTPEKRVKDK